LPVLLQPTAPALAGCHPNHQVAAKSGCGVAGVSPHRRPLEREGDREPPPRELRGALQTKHSWRFAKLCLPHERQFQSPSLKSLGPPPPPPPPPPPASRRGLRDRSRPPPPPPPPPPRPRGPAMPISCSCFRIREITTALAFLALSMTFHPCSKTRSRTSRSAVRRRAAASGFSSFSSMNRSTLLSVAFPPPPPPPPPPRLRSPPPSRPLRRLDLWRSLRLERCFLFLGEGLRLSL